MTTLSAKLDPRTVESPWGFILPQENGIRWQFNTGGPDPTVTQITGIFIPLPRPVTQTADGTKIDLLIELRESRWERHYQPTPHEGRDPDRIWTDIQETLGLTLETVNPPPDHPTSQEGLDWVQITEYDPVGTVDTWLKQFLEITVAFVTPNSDKPES